MHDLRINIIKTNLYVTFDNIARELFGALIRVPNDEVARRAFHDALSNPQSPMAGHQEDYDLLYLGTIDQLGNLDPEGVQVIARGADWIAANKENTK